MTWKDTLQIENEATFITSSKDGEPHGIVVIVKGLIDNKILINVCQMEISLKNLQENNKCCLVTIQNGEYYRIEGTGNWYSTGKYFDLAVERNTPGTPEPRLALLININAVYDLNEVKRVL